MSKNNKVVDMRGASPQHAVEHRSVMDTETEVKGRPGFQRVKHRGGGTYLKDLRAVLGLSEAEMGVLLGVGKDHVINVERRGKSIKPSARQHLIGLGRYYQDHNDLPADAWATLYKWEDNLLEPDIACDHYDRLPDDPVEDVDPYGTAWRTQRTIGKVASALIGFAFGVGATAAVAGVLI